MSRITLLATAIALAVTAAVAVSPADAKAKKVGFFYVKTNGEMYSFRVYKMKHQPKLYTNLHKALGLGPQWGLTEYIPVSGGEHEDTSSPPAQSKSHDCYDRSWSWGS